MKRLHKKIANDGQPASRLELKALTHLGEKYAKIIEKMPLGARSPLEEIMTHSV